MFDAYTFNHCFNQYVSATNNMLNVSFYPGTKIREGVGRGRGRGGEGGEGGKGNGFPAYLVCPAHFYVLVPKHPTTMRLYQRLDIRFELQLKSTVYTLR